MNKKRLLVIVLLALVVSLIGTTSASACDDCECQGCTPGYWKNHTDAWEGYSPDQLVGDVFVVPDGTEYSHLAGDTLLDALEYGGGRGTLGGARILLRAAVAGLLNAAHPNVTHPRSEDGIKEWVNAALAYGDRSVMIWMAEVMDTHNNLGCPLN